jgi:hypothetical protein
MNKFSELSIQLNNELSKTERQDNGIFFTPRLARELIFTKINIAPLTILEPSCGSGEFIQDCLTRYPKAIITGIEKHETIYSGLIKSDLYTNNLKKVRVINSDFLTTSLGKYDLIIGNPPYFVTKDKNPLCMTGRGNIFVQFIYKCLTEHLKENGILAFVLPTSFYNCSYYSPCRNYIRNNCSILHVENIDGGYYETGQDTMIMIIQNNRNNLHNFSSVDKFFFKNNYITPFYKELNSLLVGSTTILDLGFRVKTGEVVWNQHKDKLVSDSSVGIPVIYQTNIVDNKIVLDNLKSGKNEEKRQYISGYSGTPITGPAILISRGFGNKYNFVFASIEDTNFKFYGENHVNVVYSTTNDVSNFQRIKASLNDPRTQQFIQMFVGNGALSKTELETILPIF